MTILQQKTAAVYAAYEVAEIAIDTASSEKTVEAYEFAKTAKAAYESAYEDSVEAYNQARDRGLLG